VEPHLLDSNRANTAVALAYRDEVAVEEGGERGRGPATSALARCSTDDIVAGPSWTMAQTCSYVQPLGPPALPLPVLYSAAERCSSVSKIGEASTCGIGGGASWWCRRWSSCITSSVGRASGAASMQLAALRTLPFAR
jgi:hypothetical protein